MKKFTLHELEQEYKEYQKEKENLRKTLAITLKEELTTFFLEKLDAIKFLDRVAKHFKIKNEATALKKVLNIHPQIELNEYNLKKVYRENNLVNQILTIEEKKALKYLFLTENMKKLEKQINYRAKIELEPTVYIETESAKNKLKKERNEFLGFIKNCNKTLEQNQKPTNPHELRKFIKNKIKRINYYKNKKNILEFGEEIMLEHLERKFKEFLPNSEKIKKQNLKKDREEIIKEERKKRIEYEEKIKEFKEQQEQELLKKIENRKNGQIVENIDIQKISKDEPIIIEAYLDDFDSKRSRFTLSVMTANNIHLTFYNGIIKLLNEDESYEEIFFKTSGNILTFINQKYFKNISINITSNEILNDILNRQTSSKIYADMILNCLSIIHYINTFYNEKEKIEVIIENAKTFKTNLEDVTNSQELKTSIVYLNRIKKQQSFRTIKIKKGKRKIEGVFLIRGHWRRQKYLSGVKLIWIEPFWKGIGKEKQRIYKILR